MLSEKLKNLALVIVSTLIGVLLCEGFLSVFSVTDHFQILNTPLGSSGFILKDYDEKGRDVRWFNRLTSDPFVKDPFQIQDVKWSSKDKETKILFLGDSGTFGSGAQKDEVFATLIGNKLKEDFPQRKFKIINAGVPGAIPLDSLWIYEKYLIALKPDVVVFTIFMANDINQSYLQYDYNTIQLNSWLQKFSLYKLIYLYNLNRKHKTGDSFFQNIYPEKADEFNLSILDFIDGEVSTYNTPYSSHMQEAMERFLRF